MQSRLIVALCTAVLAVTCAQADPNRIRLLEGSVTLGKLSPQQQNEDVKGYLTVDSASLATRLQPPPADGSEAAKADLDMFHELYDHATSERWETALGDDATVYDRFSLQAGLPIDRQHVPGLVHLLNRAAVDAFAVTSVAKKSYARARPYQVMQLRRVCGMAKAPSPERGSVQGTSYPSGHAVVSWVVALVLSEVMPSSAQAVIGRAVTYGESRVVCGLHFPSDVEAGHRLASAVAARLFDEPAFVHDLKCARREFEAVSNGERAEDLPACQP